MLSRDYLNNVNEIANFICSLPNSEQLLVDFIDNCLSKSKYYGDPDEILQYGENEPWKQVYYYAC